MVDLYVDGEVISTTAEHTFCVPDKGWVEARDLQIGSLLQTEDGRIIDVDKVEKREGQFEVYNFKVEDFHTYFVSALPYSPDFNPIELWWSQLKSFLRMFAPTTSSMIDRIIAVALNKHESSTFKKLVY